MVDVEVVVSHHERTVVRVGDVFLKIDSDQARTDVELEAMQLANVPTPRVLWRRAPILALAGLRGEQLARPGEMVRTSPDAWGAAGAAARDLHSLPLPPWPGWRAADFAEYVDNCCRWLVDNDVVERGIVERSRNLVDTSLRPFPLVFTHGDFQPAHVFVDGPNVVGIIDWADACQGDALFDLAVLTVGFAEHLDDVLRGYGADVDRDIIRGWWALRRLASVRWMIEHDFNPRGDIAALRSNASSTPTARAGRPAVR